MTRILTNSAAMAALQTLRTIESGLQTTQNHVSSGLRVENAADNAAYWSIATTMRSDNRALSSVGDALGLGAAKVDTAYAAMESVIGVAKEIKAKLVAAYSVDTDRPKIQEEIDQLQAQLGGISESATFSGENWLQGIISDGGAPPVEMPMIKQVVASFLRTSSGEVSVTTVGYPLDSSTVLFDKSGGKLGILDRETTIGGLPVSVSTFKIDSATTTQDLDDLIEMVDAAIENMTSAAASLGSIQKRIGAQQDFVSSLTDVIDKGVGRLVDSDMNAESVQLKALQTQEQLGIQALSIANSSSKNLLQLFQ